jgi:hypothetical protein
MYSIAATDWAPKLLSRHRANMQIMQRFFAVITCFLEFAALADHLVANLTDALSGHICFKVAAKGGLLSLVAR